MFLSLSLSEKYKGEWPQEGCREEGFEMQHLWEVLWLAIKVENTPKDSQWWETVQVHLMWQML